MTVLKPRQTVPALEVSTLQGPWSLGDQAPENFTMLVFYRGLHCPICSKYLAELEKLGCLRTVITQNIDSLHQQAGNTDVIEFHGHARTLRCDDCGRRYKPKEVSYDDLPPRCTCGGPLRPDFVFFGEPIPVHAHMRAMDVARQCDVLLVIGTSAVVAPASHIPVVAKESGAFIIEINPVPSALTNSISDIYIPAPAGKAMPLIVDEVKTLKG